MVESISVPYNDIMVSNLRYELGCDMAIAADSEILGDPDWCSRLSIQKGKHNGQFLTVNGDIPYLLPPRHEEPNQSLEHNLPLSSSLLTHLTPR